jgi:hypothetical protein
MVRGISVLGFGSCRFPDFAQTDHALRFHVPNLQPQTTKNITRVQRSGFGLLQLRNFAKHFGQAVNHAMMGLVFMKLEESIAAFS